jgi:hypothetical protein
MISFLTGIYYSKGKIQGFCMACLLESQFDVLQQRIIEVAIPRDIFLNLRNILPSFSLHHGKRVTFTTDKNWRFSIVDTGGCT